tara:strand:- start:1630 stop:1776 length:147 start_codon:yes stop_codon:yes gene_type:complete
MVRLTKIVKVVGTSLGLILNSEDVKILNIKKGDTIELDVKKIKTLIGD